MTAPWGPALDAEVAYRQEQLRTQFGRRAGRPRRTGRRQAIPAQATQTLATQRLATETTVSADPAMTAAARPGASVDTIGRIPAQRTVATEPAAAAGDRAGRRAA